MHDWWVYLLQHHLGGNLLVLALGVVGTIGELLTPH